MNKEAFSVVYDQLSTITTPVFSYVPQDNENYPFTKIELIDADNNDTDLELGFVEKIQVTTFSRYRGITEVSDIMKSIYDALHRFNLPDTANFGFSSIVQEFSTVIESDDGVTRLGVQRFNLIYEGV